MITNDTLHKPNPRRWISAQTIIQVIAVLLGVVALVLIVFITMTPVTLTGRYMC